MSHPAPFPEFGDCIPCVRYAARPGAYAVITDSLARIAVMQTPRGCFLPGGGCEVGETPEQTLMREVREECGFAVTSVQRIGEAVEYVHTAGQEFGLRKESVFFAATIEGVCGSASESDHELLWMEPAEAAARLAHGSQRWAVQQFVGKTGEP